MKGSTEDPVEIFLNQQKATLAAAGVVFDGYFRESSLHASGAVDEGLADLKRLGHTYEEEGALWFRTTAFGDDKDRVLVKSDGSRTYFAVDVAYHRDKVRRGFTRILNIFGADHHGYLGRLNAAVKALSQNQAELEVIVGQLVSLTRGGEPVRMSKRTGDMITFDDVLEEVGVDATRWYLAAGKASSPLDFDLAVAVQKSNDNPVFYAQYAHARLCSVERKAAEAGLVAAERLDGSSLAAPSAVQLAVWLARFPDEIAEMAKSREVHHLPRYLTELAAAVHKHYGESRFVDPAAPAATAQHLLFLKAARSVLALGLGLMGVSAPPQM